MKTRIIQILFFLIFVFPVYAGHELSRKALTGIDLKNSAVKQLLLEEQFYGKDPDHNMCIPHSSIESARFQLILRNAGTSWSFHTNWKFTVNVSIKRYNAEGAVVGERLQESLMINHSTTERCIDRILYLIPEGNFPSHKVVVNVTSITYTDEANNPITTDYPVDIFLELELDVDRSYPFNADNNMIDITRKAMVGHELPIYWSYQPGAESYDVEWLFVESKYNIQGGEPQNIKNFIEFDLRNANRINTGFNFFNIPCVYPAGYIVYRVRPVGVDDSGNPMPGLWDYYQGSNLYLSHVPAGNIAEIAGIDNEMNWQYESVFAEGGKRKEVLTYYDGSLRSRQTLSYTNTDRNVLIQEPVYDYQGRATIDVMAAPAGNPQGLKFYQGFNGSYGPENFDVDSKYDNPDIMPANIAGASQYYSTQNADKSGVNAFIPIGNAYCYTLRKFMPDGTNRITFESTPGYSYSTDHLTRYTYGVPESQDELDRLFGTDVGDVLHYKKNSVRDANGQYTVSYLNQAGKPVATAVAGSVPDAVLAVDGKPLSETATVDILRNETVTDNERTTSQTFTVTKPGTYTFSYTFNPTTVIDDCLDGSLGCNYDGDIRLKDMFGEELASASFIDEKSVSGTSCSFQYSLLPGSYQISKSLRLRTPGVHEYIQSKLIEGEGCFRKAPVRPAPCKCKDLCFFAYCIVPIYGDTIWLDQNGNITPDRNVSIQLINECIQGCDEQTEPPSKCSLMEQLLKVDVSPGGQYFDNLPNKYTIVQGQTILNPYYNPNGWLTGLTVMSNDEDFHAAFSESSSITFSNDPEVGVSQRIAWLRSHWQESYSNELLIYHPEYELYLFSCEESCGSTSVMALNFYDGVMEKVVNDLASGNKDTYYNPLGLTQNTTTSGCSGVMNGYPDYVSSAVLLSNADPIVGFNCSMNGENCDIATVLGNRLKNFLPFMDGQTQKYYSIWYVLENPDDIHSTTCHPNLGIRALFQTLHGNPNALPPTSGILSTTVEPGKMTKYQFFRNVYLFWRQYYLYKMLVYKDEQDPDFGFLPDDDHNGVSDQGFYIRYPRQSMFDDIDLSASCDPEEGWAEEMIEQAETDLAAGCEASCEEAAGQWTERLLECDPNIDLQDLETMKNLMIELCKGNCSEDNYLGSGGCYQQHTHDLNCFYVTNPPSLDPLYNFDEIFALFGYSSCETPVHPDTLRTNELAECSCDKYKQFVYELGGDSEALTELQSLYPELYYTASDLEAWSDACFSPRVTMEILETPALKFPEVFLCEEYATPPHVMTQAELEHICDSVNLSIAELNSEMYNQMFADSMANRIFLIYCDECMQQENLQEHFLMTYERDEFCYTLYYYDQAGNLVQTVPPEGVAIIADAQILNDVKLNRRNGLARVLPDHSLVTAYTYNSLNAVKTKTSPDEGQSEYWYDNKGRLIISQNAKQKPNDEYSYTVYDAFSRVIETGEGYRSSPPTDIETEGDDFSYPGTYFSSKRNLIQTTYDNAPSGYPFEDEHLRSRVVCTQTYNDFVQGADPDIITYYSYDIQGNVRSMIHRIPSLPETKQDFRIDYEYDLISGNVNAVHYQDTKPDAFHHRYEYDADNRITNVYTSQNRLLWDQDAEYFYYKHGPLARQEIGQHKVQGMDYVYTLQGWIKSVNSNSLNPLRDPAKDGLSPGVSTSQSYSPFPDLHTHFARDAGGYSLNYYTGDYADIKGIASGDHFLASNTNTTYSLYNGNISSMATSFSPHFLPSSSNLNFDPILAFFRYDQLNRIKEMKSLTTAALSTVNQWPEMNQSDNKYKSSYTYDFNGNITNLVRYDKTGGMFDNLTYQYDIDTKTHWMGSNRLYHLDDAIVTANTIDDLEDQGTFNPTVLTNNNYRYDEIGNLTQDASENIGEVKWNVWGKIREIITTSNATEAQNIEYRYDATGNRFAKILKPVIDNEVSDESQWTTWFYLRDAQGNPMALYKRTYEDLAGNAWKQHFKLEELTCYGSSRLGVLDLSIPENSQYLDVWAENFTATINTEGRFVVTAYGTIVTPPASNLYSHRCGIRNYEFTNHLGNVLYTFTDHKLPHTTNNQSIDYYLTDITSAQDYYPGGMLMPGRSYSSDSYRFGFNGKENDNEVTGWQDYGFREYDRRINRFFSVDPLTLNYPMLTPYQYASNNPIMNIDLDGLEGLWSMTTFNDGLKTSLNHLYSAEEAQKEYENYQKGTAMGAGLGVGLGFGGYGVANYGIKASLIWLGIEATESVLEELTGIPIIPLAPDPTDLADPLINKTIRKQLTVVPLPTKRLNLAKKYLGSESHTKYVDINKPVYARTVREGQFVQYRIKGQEGTFGDYYAPVGTTPEQIGLDPADVVETYMVTVNKPTKGLFSTHIENYQLYYDPSRKSVGGGKQFFSKDLKKNATFVKLE